MNLSRTSSYAIQAAIHLASQKPKAATTSRVTAQTLDIPEWFLVRILKRLVDHGILRLIMGPHGGYLVARPAENISLLEIIEAVEDPVHDESPDFGVDGKTCHLNRRLEKIYDEAGKHGRKYLEQISLASLVENK